MIHADQVKADKISLDKRADRTVSGIVFNIQKFSVNDGPGIRTVVFLKGCPLRCLWCSNPESQLKQPQVLWDGEKCLHCGHCLKACPAGAVLDSAPEEKALLPAFDPLRCQGCGRCVRECPARALKLEGEAMTVEAALRTVLQDLPFYEESGGGLTISGGEMLFQPEFSYHLFLAAKEEGVSTCCETTGYARPDVFLRVTSPVDHILFDVKHWDDQAHKKGTGVDGRLPFENLAAAISFGKDVLPRIPVIPGFNDALSDAAMLSARLKAAGAVRCQLLPFHQFGENKYSLLGRPYSYKNTGALHREDLFSYRDVFAREGIDAFF